MMRLIFLGLVALCYVAWGGDNAQFFGEARIPGYATISQTIPLPSKRYLLFGGTSPQAPMKGHIFYFRREPGLWMARLTEQGALDTTFGNGGVVTMGGEGWRYSAARAVVHDDGSISAYAIAYSVVGEDHLDYAVTFRFDANGQLDAAFGQNGVRRARTFGDFSGGKSTVLRSGHVVFQGDANLLVVTKEGEVLSTASYHDVGDSVWPWDKKFAPPAIASDENGAVYVGSIFRGEGGSTLSVRKFPDLLNTPTVKSLYEMVENWQRDFPVAMVASGDWFYALGESWSVQPISLLVRKWNRYTQETDKTYGRDGQGWLQRPGYGLEMTLDQQGRAVVLTDALRVEGASLVRLTLDGQVDESFGEKGTLAFNTKMNGGGLVRDPAGTILVAMPVAVATKDDAYTQVTLYKIKD